MASYNSADVQCPFYLRDDPKTCTLTCEGVLPGTSMKSHFSLGVDLRHHIGRFCISDYKKCPWAKILNAQYRD